MTLSFSDQVRAAIQDADETYLAISKAAKVPQPNLSRFMHGKSGLSMQSLDRLAEHLGLQITVKPKRRKNRKAGK